MTMTIGLYNLTSSFCPNLPCSIWIRYGSFLSFMSRVLKLGKLGKLQDILWGLIYRSGLVYSHKKIHARVDPSWSFRLNSSSNIFSQWALSYIPPIVQKFQPSWWISSLHCKFMKRYFNYVWIRMIIRLLNRSTSGWKSYSQMNDYMISGIMKVSTDSFLFSSGGTNVW